MLKLLAAIVVAIVLYLVAVAVFPQLALPVRWAEEQEITINIPGINQNNDGQPQSTQTGQQQQPTNTGTTNTSLQQINDQQAQATQGNDQQQQTQSGMGGCGSDPYATCQSNQQYGGVAAYAQTGKRQTLTWNLTVPQGYGMVLGGYTVTGSGIDSANQPGHDDPNAGTIAAIPSGMHVNVTVTDGFYVLVPEQQLEGEYCSRLSEAQGNNWAHSRQFTPGFQCSN